MERNLTLTAEECGVLANEFVERLELADAIFDKHPFELELYGRTRPSVGVYDGVMVALDRLWPRREEIMAAKARIGKAYAKLVKSEGDTGRLTGAANTSQDIKDRIELFENMFIEAL